MERRGGKVILATERITLETVLSAPVILLQVSSVHKYLMVLNLPYTTGQNDQKLWLRQVYLLRKAQTVSNHKWTRS